MRIEGFAYTTVTRSTVIIQALPIHELVLNSNLNFNDSIYEEKQYFACHMISYLSLTAIFFQNSNLNSKPIRKFTCPCFMDETLELMGTR